MHECLLFLQHSRARTSWSTLIAACCDGSPALSMCCSSDKTHAQKSPGSNSSILVIHLRATPVLSWVRCLARTPSTSTAAPSTTCDDGVGMWGTALVAWSKALAESDCGPAHNVHHTFVFDAVSTNVYRSAGFPCPKNTPRSLHHPYFLITQEKGKYCSQFRAQNPPFD